VDYFYLPGAGEPLKGGCAPFPLLRYLYLITLPFLCVRYLFFFPPKSDGETPFFFFLQTPVEACNPPSFPPSIRNSRACPPFPRTGSTPLPSIRTEPSFSDIAGSIPLLPLSIGIFSVQFPLPNGREYPCRVNSSIP